MSYYPVFPVHINRLTILSPLAITDIIKKNTNKIIYNTGSAVASKFEINVLIILDTISYSKNRVITLLFTL